MADHRKIDRNRVEKNGAALYVRGRGAISPHKPASGANS